MFTSIDEMVDLTKHRTLFRAFHSVGAVWDLYLHDLDPVFDRHYSRHRGLAAWRAHWPGAARCCLPSRNITSS